MYSVGTSVLCGQMGVCEIEAIGVPPHQESKGQNYYKLRSVFSNSGERVYIPVDKAGSMRPLIDGSEASGYLDMLPRLKPQICNSRKLPDLVAHYQGMLAACELKDCLLLIKEVYCKQKELAGRHKNLGQVDARYLKIAERLVCEEFAAALHTMPDLIRERLYAAMEEEIPA